jgi:hypothetical protein
MDRKDYQLKYNSGIPSGYLRYYGEALPSTYAVSWCMREAEIARIFTKEDLYEFFFRLPLVFDLSDLLENWLLGNSLVSYVYKGKQYELKPEDIIMHVGLESYDYYLNHTERRRYLERAAVGRNCATDVGYGGRFPDLKMETDKLIFSHLIYSPEITPERLAKAEFFADSLLKLMHEDTFASKNLALLEKEKELKLRKERIWNLNRFDTNMIPKEIIRQCLLTAYTPEYAAQLLEDANEFRKRAFNMIYVAWVYANCFFLPDGACSPEKEVFTLDYIDFELEAGGFLETGRCNLTYNIEFSKLDTMVPLLKGVQV